MNKSAQEIIQSIDYSYRKSKDLRVYKAGARAYHTAVEKLRSMNALRQLEQHEQRMGISMNWTPKQVADMQNKVNQSKQQKS